MRISAINVNNYHVAHKNNANFKGIIKVVDHDFSTTKYGPPTSPHQIYTGWDIDSYTQTYHPFKDESEVQIAQEIEKNNDSYTMDCGGVAVDIEHKTTRGKTIPFTEREWNNLSEEMKEKFKALL